MRQVGCPAHERQDIATQRLGVAHMTVPNILEALMLTAFSIGWYWSISVMLWTRRPYGKSSAFICCTIAGYGMGLVAQILEWQSGAAFSYLIILYSWNLAMTTVDLALVVYFTRKSLKSPTHRTIILESHLAQSARCVDLFPDRVRPDQGIPRPHQKKKPT